jgi:hypothetical protein
MLVRAAAAIGILVVAGVAQATLAPQRPLFQCSVEALHETLSPDGDPATSTQLQAALKTGASFTFHTLSGVVRWEFARPGWAQIVFPAGTRTLEVWQTGTASNDWVALRRIHGAASSPAEVLRVRARQAPIRFSWLDYDGKLLRGTCTTKNQ